MFIDRTRRLRDNRALLAYGVAVTDLDGDGAFELVVAGFGHANRVLAWREGGLEDVAPPALADPAGHGIGVAAGDLDGDGREELYVLNTDTFGGPKRASDRLFVRRREGGWTDLFAAPSLDRALANRTAGRSVACLDRDGDGRYGFMVASYGGPMRLYELDGSGALIDAAPAAHLDEITGGRALVCGPILGGGRGTDVFAANELGPNFLFRARGDGTYQELAERAGVADPLESGRGVALLDANGDGRLDLVCGNWEGPHRLFIQGDRGGFMEAAPLMMAAPSRVRTVIAADFDNDGFEEIFFNNIGEPNQLFGWREGSWRPIDVGAALEPTVLGTGAAVGDFDGDGRLELLIAHGESGEQPLTYYEAQDRGHAWLRVLPRTRRGAPARGALVTLRTGGRRQLRVIDSGSGYLCQMEPVAHFGLGGLDAVESVEVRWQDGAVAYVDSPPVRRTIEVRHPAG